MWAPGLEITVERDIYQPAFNRRGLQGKDRGSGRCPARGHNREGARPGCRIHLAPSDLAPLTMSFRPMNGWL